MALIELIAALHLLLGHSSSQPDAPVVETSYGKFRGKIVYSGPPDNKTIYAFMGIPYALPPIHENRFKKPQRIPPFDAIMNTTMYQPACAQVLFMRALSSEDCLYLNIFSPNLKPETPLAVGVWIHGGAFTLGGPMEMNEDVVANNFASRDIVLVNVAYRLGAFGFFASAGDEVPANVAIWDLILALQWVQEEIANFGGDPDRVTIFGVSAGSILCDLLQLSPAAQGLFHQMILMSGVSSSNIGFGARNSSLELAASLGCVESQFDWVPENMASIVSCLQEKSTDEILDQAETMDFMEGWLPAYYGPDDLFPKSMEELRQTRKPIRSVVGITRDENSATFIGQVLSGMEDISSFTPDKVMSKAKSMYLKAFQKSFDDLPQPEAENLVRLAYISGFDNPDTDNNFWFKQYTVLVDDIEYAAPAYTTTKSLAKAGKPTFLYQFDYLSDNAMRSDKIPFRGVAHAYDVMLMEGAFGAPPLGLPFDMYYNATADDFVIYDKLGKMWTEFIRSGCPNGKNSPDAPWQAVSYNSTSEELEAKYYSIKTEPEMKERFKDTAVSLWVKLMPFFEQKEK